MRPPQHRLEQLAGEPLNLRRLARRRRRLLGRCLAIAQPARTTRPCVGHHQPVSQRGDQFGSRRRTFGSATHRPTAHTSRRRGQPAATDCGSREAADVALGSSRQVSEGPWTPAGRSYIVPPCRCTAGSLASARSCRPATSATRRGRSWPALAGGGLREESERLARLISRALAPRRARRAGQRARRSTRWSSPCSRRSAGE